MAGNEGRTAGAEAKRLRKELGTFVRLARVNKDMTQKQLADKLGLEFYTFVSSVENGASRIPDL